MIWDIEQVTSAGRPFTQSWGTSYNAVFIDHSSCCGKKWISVILVEHGVVLKTQVFWTDLKCFANAFGENMEYIWNEYLTSND